MAYSNSDSRMERILSEFQAQPTLQLTPEQAAKLFAIELHECTRLLDALVVRGWLRVAGDRRYVVYEKPTSAVAVA